MKIPVEDRLEIQELTHCYAHYCDTRKIDLLLEHFADDAVVDETEIGLPRAQGRAALRGYFTEGAKPLSHMMHLIGNHLISSYDGDTASGQASFLAVARVAQDGSRVQIFGYYDDKYVKRNGRWLFQSRYVVSMMPPEMGSMVAS
jgi:ketosteroid isomerase-like protein